MRKGSLGCYQGFYFIFRSGTTQNSGLIFILNPGTDEYSRPQLRYYDCGKGRCYEIYDLECDRKCGQNDTYITATSGSYVIMINIFFWLLNSLVRTTGSSICF